ncbi:MAG: hypothetical protein JW827_10450, partial [Spirochaetes bacterium]|nr:hypothetical protein [Spirochaetota bacterium]
MDYQRSNFIFIALAFLFLAEPVLAVQTSVTNRLSDEEFKIHFEKGKEFFLQKKYSEAVLQWNVLIKNKQLNDELKEMLFESYLKIYQSKSFYFKGLEHYYLE